jgi:ubiquinol-cytochrome c reductase cytochrome c subunit
MKTRALLGVVVAALLVCGPAAAGPPLVEVGKNLYGPNCSTCHGSNGEGIAAKGPSLKTAGALAADFYLRTGYMPLSSPGQQPSRRRVLLSDYEIRALTAYVASLGNGPPIPRPQPDRGRVSDGQRLFTEHCAGCHQVAAEGGYVTDARVPPLHEATDVQIAQAVRIGPYVMPRFTRSDISDRQLDSIIAYVNYAKHPDDRGGWSIGHIGPIPEGMVTWLLAATVLVATCMALGKRLKGGPE